MEKISKEEFCTFLAIRPYSMIGREISLQDGAFIRILDISLGGNYIFIKDEHMNATKWIDVNHLGEEISIDNIPKIDDKDIVSVQSLYDKMEKEMKKIADITIKNRDLTKDILKCIKKDKPSNMIDFNKKKNIRPFRH